MIGERLSTLPALLPGALLILILPISHTVSLRLLLLAITLAIAFVVWRRESAPSLPARNALISWGLLAIASLAWSVDLEYSVGEVINEVGYAMATYFSFFVLTRSDRDLRLLLRAVLLATALASTIGIVNYLRVDDWQVGKAMGIGDRNAFSTTISLASMALLFAASERRLEVARPALIWTVILLGLVAASLTLNRTMWLAIGAGAALFLVIGKPRLISRGGGHRLTLAVAILAVGLGMAQFVVTSHIKLAEESRQSGLVEKIVNDERGPIWRYGLARAAEQPLHGHGFGRGILRKDFRSKLGDDFAWHGHNVFLNQAISLGVPGLCLFAWVIVCLALFIARVDGDDDVRKRMLKAFAAALLGAMLVRGLADDVVVRENALLFWALLGAIFRRVSVDAEAATASAHNVPAR